MSNQPTFDVRGRIDAGRVLGPLARFLTSLPTPERRVVLTTRFITVGFRVRRLLPA